MHSLITMKMDTDIVEFHGGDVTKTFFFPLSVLNTIHLQNMCVEFFRHVLLKHGQEIVEMQKQEIHDVTF